MTRDAVQTAARGDAEIAPKPQASVEALEAERAAGFAVYVHWPFCASKCPYCDFNSHVRHGGVDETRFLRAYLNEIAETAARTGPQTVTSIFFGGGTPSLMAPDTVATILDAIAKHWAVPPGIEVSLEANPSSVEADRFAGYRSAGINRVSLGIQAMNDADLQALGRLHTAAEAQAAIGIAQRTFERTSFDLIYARPSQTLAAWRRELTEALATAAGHLSLYQLTIEPGTPFHALHAAGKLTLPEPELAEELFLETQALCGSAGLPAYEISNHARPGDACQHNLVYWRYGTYAGIGPGAHGRIRFDDALRATETHKLPERWLDAVEATGHGRTSATPISPAEQMDEALLMGLRLGEGLDVSRAVARTGFQLNESALAPLVNDGLVRLEHGASGLPSDEDSAPTVRLTATETGRFVLDWVIPRVSAAFRAPGVRN